MKHGTQANPKPDVCMEWHGNGHKFRSVRFWITEGWSNSFLQKWNGQTWVTLY